MQTISKQDVVDAFNSAKQSGADRFDPIAFYFCQLLVGKLDLGVGVTVVHLNTVKEKIDALVSRYEAARIQAESILNKIEEGYEDSDYVDSDYVDSLEQAQRLYDARDFNALASLYSAQTRESAHNRRINLLKELKRDIEITRRSREKQTQAYSLDAILDQQLVEELANHGFAQQKSQSGEQLELHSMTVFKEQQKKHDIDAILDQALSSIPAGAGPHNPHMLMIKTISIMRDLSPDYARRFASYMETTLSMQRSR